MIFEAKVQLYWLAILRFWFLTFPRRSVLSMPGPRFPSVRRDITGEFSPVVSG